MTRPRKALSFLAQAAVVALVLAMLLPVVYMIGMSFRTAEEINAAPLGLPDTLYLGNYARALDQMGYWRAVVNSVGITISVTALVALLGSLAAYPLARRANRFTKGVVMLVALGLATPPFVTITPIYVIFRNLGLLDSYPGIILAFTALNLPLAVFFYTSFISAIPRELEEAARLDNCNDWQIYWYVIRPLLGPATATLSLFVMLMVWNDFVYPLLLMTSPEKFTVMVSVYRFVGNLNIQPEMLFPAAVLGSLPLLVLFLFFQRRIVAGVTAGAVK
ncbi:carbohydrate ABC transporter permease [Pseudoruegeria sp. SHC-113]|uniref:carbohydrate ABC transporter permease n=1 Tax=Pseudoruegeria sp. SHC-113 TaxID=2855439 RepID=UPI0021BA5295|nr:carbohydrate ABC transporter permease [Pseudoruegeria sp. SHC-113]MCT8161711.1 carbohydrate ABC transporter permease [Pseudoruegeria sp. SHC-113]